MEYRKLNEENDNEYILRICSMKEQNNWTWEDIAKILNESLGNNFGESAYRKKYQHFKKMLEDNESKIFPEDAYLKKIQEERIGFEKAKKQFQDQRREYNKLIADSARYEHLEEELIKAAMNLNEKKILNNDNYYTNTSDNEALLVLSDWHYGMVTDNIWNKFNIEICEQRVNRLCQKAKQYLELHNINVLHIMLLGDFINGSIHSTVRVASEENTCEQLMNVSELLAETICELSSVVNKINIYSTYGNHARTIQNKNDSIHSDNLERILPWWLKCRFMNNKKIDIYDMKYEFINCYICGHSVVGVHGDLENFSKLGVDVYTLFSKQYGIDVEYVFMGDKHHNKQYDVYGIETTLVSSLCGTDNYANDKRLYSKAGQTLCIFNREDAKVCTYHITF